ncbi:PQQ-dependent sugar dehydrogenase [Chondrinema litorale]|uniref:PQQ-dependent sugar dehydrogenase n=1 Tax=Chondrinema litorale TaxID=2994555 RepID=UPI002542D05F|nr:PQQ-dependent sugar dehydrogenase [Chondrinema litorale]UZR93328.1 PQQ-dependent sugar dehydrogenase [Chondrinema litorale]
MYSKHIFKIAYILLISSFFYSCDKQNADSETTSNVSNLPVADNDNGGIELPSGFGAVTVAKAVGKARHLTVDEKGSIYIKLRKLENENGVIVLSDTTGDGKYDVKSAFGDYVGTGVHLYNGYLYVSSDTSVYRYKLENGLVPSGAVPETVVSGFPTQRSHEAKSLAFDNAGHMYVNVGAPSNACMETGRTPGSPGLDPCPQLEFQAGIWQFDANKLNQVHQVDGHRYATGIRNSVALEWNISANSLYAVQHGRDQLSNLFSEFYDDEQSAELPSEEFLKISDGDDFGWPYCYYDHFQDKKILAPEYGGDGKKTGRCENVVPPILTFPAHWAPNDLLFYTGDLFPEKYKNGAFIAFHGSWNRGPYAQQGYSVVFVPFKDGMPSGEWERFATGFAGVDSVMSTSDAKHRPMGLTQGPDGSLYISDSVEGKIWRVLYYDEKLASLD